MRSRPSDIGHCCLNRLDDGRVIVLQADKHILVADEVLEDLELLNPLTASYGDGILTIHATGGDLSYGLSEHDLLTLTWLGTRCGE